MQVPLRTRRPVALRTAASSMRRSSLRTAVRALYSAGSCLAQPQAPGDLRVGERVGPVRPVRLPGGRGLSQPVPMFGRLPPGGSKVDGNRFGGRGSLEGLGHGFAGILPALGPAAAPQLTAANYEKIFLRPLPRDFFFCLSAGSAAPGAGVSGSPDTSSKSRLAFATTSSKRLNRPSKSRCGKLGLLALLVSVNVSVTCNIFLSC